MAHGLVRIGRRLLQAAPACLAMVSGVAAAERANGVSPLPALEFQGLALGSSSADARRHFRYLQCRSDTWASPTADTVCVDDPQARCHPQQVFRIPAEHRDCAERLASLRTYAGTELSSVRLYFLNGKLLQVELVFPTAAFDAVVDAVTGRYGDPASTDSNEIRNRFGASFRDSQARWTLPDGSISISRLTTDFSRGTMRLVATERPIGANLLPGQGRRALNG